MQQSSCKKIVSTIGYFLFLLIHYFYFYTCKHSAMNPVFRFAYLFCFISFLLISKSICAQANAPLFYVYEIHGNVSLQNLTLPQNAIIKKAEFINNTETIVINNDTSGIILFDKNSNFFTLNKKGNYTTESILKNKKEHLKDEIFNQVFILFLE